MTSRSWQPTWIRYHKREQGRHELPAMQCGVPTCRMPNGRQGSNAGVVGESSGVESQLRMALVAWDGRSKSEHFQLAVQGCALVLVISGDEQSESRRQSQGASARECDGVFRWQFEFVFVAKNWKTGLGVVGKLGGGTRKKWANLRYRCIIDFMNREGGRERGKERAGRRNVTSWGWIVSLELQTFESDFYGW